MTALPYSYASAALLNSQPLRPSEPAPVAAPAVSVQPDGPTDRILAQYNALDKEQRAELVGTMDRLGLKENQQVLGFLSEHFSRRDILGNDPALMTPLSQGMATLVDTHEQATNQGRTTAMDPTEQAILRSQIENLLKGMGNAPVEQKIQAARGITNTPEAAAYAEQSVIEITAPEKFTILGGAETPQPMFAPIATLAAVATFETASVQNSREQDWLSNLVKPDFAKLEELERNKFRAPVGPGPSVALQAAAEALGNGNEMLGELPLQKLPNVLAAATPGRDTGNGRS